MAQVELLPFSKIHGIRPSQSSSGNVMCATPVYVYNYVTDISSVPPASDACGSRNVLVFGQKSLRFVALQAGGISVMRYVVSDLHG